MRNRSTADRWAALAALPAGIFLATSACALVLLAGAVLFVHPTVSASPTQNAVTVGGLHYAVNNAWVLDPHRGVDAQIARGLPVADKDLRSDELLYAVFLGVTNETDKRLPMAADVALRDSTNRKYTAVPLGADNRYAYRPRIVAPKTHRPAPSTPAGEDLSADGLMLVFRIPRSAYENGSLELLVHDPGRPAHATELQVV